MRRGGEVLGEPCGVLCDSCGLAELSRRDADEPLEVRGGIEPGHIVQQRRFGELRRQLVLLSSDLLGELRAARISSRYSAGAALLRHLPQLTQPALELRRPEARAGSRHE